jgi:glycosyltransferase involved in cell wall biosynthesis
MNQSKRAVIAIPALNESVDLADCLASLSIQRDSLGEPIGSKAFEVLIYANNCTDHTAEVAREWAARMLQPITIVEEKLPNHRANAGWARKRAMDLAANRLELSGGDAIFTTDADSCVAPNWVQATWTELDRGVDCVAGYVGGKRQDILILGTPFVNRCMLEETYKRLAAEIYARCDPRPHDPWPNHRVSSGASLAVRLSAYRAIGGLPARGSGEDKALTQALDDAGFKVRHSTDVYVSTSYRLNGRAQGGAADTIRHRLETPDAFCDDDLEPALRLVRRALCRGHLRRFWDSAFEEWNASFRWGISAEKTLDISHKKTPFSQAWESVCRENPQLAASVRLCPSDLPRQIAIAKRLLRLLDADAVKTNNFQDDRFRSVESDALEFA